MGASLLPRQSTGKRLRFQVFERDGFMCRYCGAQPPDVVLVVDHVLPVSGGGTHTLSNLVSACEPCNQGKAARVLGDAAPRPDADMLYLEAQQEIAELRRYQLSLAAIEATLGEIVAQLQDRWADSSGLSWVPSDALIRRLIKSYGHEVAGEALDEVVWKAASGYLREADWHRYLWVVARNLAARTGEGAA